MSLSSLNNQKAGKKYKAMLAVFQAWGNWPHKTQIPEKRIAAAYWQQAVSMSYPKEMKL